MWEADLCHGLPIHVQGQPQKPPPKKAGGGSKVNGNVNDALLATAGWRLQSQNLGLVTFFWNFPGGGAEYVTRVAPGRPIV